MTAATSVMRIGEEMVGFIECPLVFFTMLGIRKFYLETLLASMFLSRLDL